MLIHREDELDEINTLSALYFRLVKHCNLQGNISQEIEPTTSREFTWAESYNMFNGAVLSDDVLLSYNR